MSLRPTTGAFVGALLSFVVLVGLYAAEVWDFVQLRTSEVAALTREPRLWWAVPVLLLAVVGVGIYVWALKAQKPVSYPGFRLLPILLVAVLFVDYLVLSSAAVPIPSRDQTAVAMAVLQRQLIAQTKGSVQRDPQRLRPFIQELGAPPYFVNGKPAEQWHLQVREGCEGPVGEAPGVAPMTFIYCVGKDRKVAWITVVSLPAEQKFGPPGMFGRNGNVQMVAVFDPQEETGDGRSPGDLVTPPTQPPFERERGLTPPEADR